MLQPHLVLAVPLICMLMQAKAKIMVVRDVEREDVEFISKTLGCLPIAHIDHMRPEKLGSAELVEEVDVSVWVERGAGGGGCLWGWGGGGGAVGHSTLHPANSAGQSKDVSSECGMLCPH